MNNEEIRQKAIECGKADLEFCSEHHCDDCDLIDVNPCNHVRAYEQGFADGVKEGKQLSTTWIPVTERLPEEHEWCGTKVFGTTISDEVYVTFESPDGKHFTKHLSFQNGKVSSFVQKEIDVLFKGSEPIAWMPLPEPFKEGEKA